MKRKAAITVQSRDTAYRADGVIEELADGVRITYREPPELRMGAVTTTMTVRGAVATLSRDGTVRCALRFEEGKLHRSVYATTLGTFQTELKTHSLRARMDGRGGVLELRYRLTIGGVQNEHVLKLLVRTEA